MLHMYIYIYERKANQNIHNKAYVNDIFLVKIRVCMLHSNAMNIVYESTDRISTSERFLAYNDTADVTMKA